MRGTGGGALNVTQPDSGARNQRSGGALPDGRGSVRCGLARGGAKGRVLAGVLALACASVAGCERKGGAAGESPLLYCSVDTEFAREVLAEYERRTGVKVRVIFDTEAAKTTGLVQRILDEEGQTGADLFWSNEIFNTILLSRRGRLAAYVSPAAADIPEAYKCAAGTWTAFGMRARVVAFDSAVTPRASLPTTWEAYAAPEWASKLAIANPLFGTTRGHVAAAFALWGEDRGRAYLERLRAGGAAVLDSNSATVRAVLSGNRVIAFTDTDDVIVARKQRPTLDMIYPDLGDGGTVLIPNSVAIVRGGAHRREAESLYDFLVSADVERMLARSDSRNIPVRSALCEELGVTAPPASKLTFARVADALEASAQAAREILLK
ncbi:MAG: extracellular solute-binding protein [Planctomycetota bacterium]|nr:MAG: extracellular solute-binding protein [Planctomycetota bacterium]MCQ3920721.1 hypothetical protein [Planctomycetota bacterium]